MRSPQKMKIALKQRDRVHRVCFKLPVTILQKVIVAMDDEYLILEYLAIGLTGDISRNNSSHIFATSG